MTEHCRGTSIGTTAIIAAARPSAHHRPARSRDEHHLCDILASAQLSGVGEAVCRLMKPDVRIHPKSPGVPPGNPRVFLVSSSFYMNTEPQL
jgi:hypothetical protein